MDDIDVEEWDDRCLDKKSSSSSSEDIYFEKSSLLSSRICLIILRRSSLFLLSDADKALLYDFFRRLPRLTSTARIFMVLVLSGSLIGWKEASLE